MEKKVQIRKAWDEAGSLTTVRALGLLGIRCYFDSDNGQGAIIVSMDDADDEALLRLWDELSDLRVRYIEAKQDAVVTQLSYLGAGNDPTEI